MASSGGSGSSSSSAGSPASSRSGGGKDGDLRNGGTKGSSGTTASTDGQTGDSGQQGDEPGFETGTAGGASLPDLRDEPTLEDGLPGLEQIMAEAAEAGASGGGAAGSDDSQPGKGQAGGAGASAGAAAGIPGGVLGPLTPAEQVAILDARLEQGTGEFDAMILEEQTAQRRAQRERPAPQSEQGSDSSGGGSSPYGGDIADAGGYSTGGGMGGASRGGQIPQNTAKYPPPGDIPSGDDDDVVARQLREAAMREPDPKVREALWEEYRKYKGIGQ
ncbi:MAG: hypothetical protein ACK5HY_15850 [Parahaliea sp.]